MTRRDRIAEPWGARTPYGRGDEWPTRVDEYLADDVAAQSIERWVPSEVPAADIREAARIIGTAEALLSTVLQGFYQSNQATAAALQVNNIHILRGMLGKPGCGVLQMNGQPTAENTWECGADGGGG